MAAIGAPERRFDAYPWRQPVTESSYINSLANRPYSSTVKTLPATLPEPWAVVRGQRLAVKASRLASRGRRNGGYCGGLPDPDRIGSRGGAYDRGYLRLGHRAGDGWVEATQPFFIYLPHLVLSAILDVTYSVTSCTAPR